MEQLPVNAIRHLAEFHYSNWFVQLPPGVGFDQLFDPIFWQAHTKRLRQFDRVRVRASDGAFDVSLTVTGVMAAGVIMELLTVPDMAANLATQAHVEKLWPTVE